MIFEYSLDRDSSEGWLASYLLPGWVIRTYGQRFLSSPSLLRFAAQKLKSALYSYSSISRNRSWSSSGCTGLV